MTRKPDAGRHVDIAGAAVAGALCVALAACSGGGKKSASDGIDAGTTVVVRSDPVSIRELGGLTVIERTDPVAEAPAAVAEGLETPRRGGHYKLGQPYEVAGSWYTPKEDTSYDEIGRASWYGGKFHGRLTANGEIFDAQAVSAAHPTLPLPSYVRVTNLDNDRSIIVRVNDRGPYRYNRLIDVSERTAEILGFKRAGKANVRVQYVDRAELDADDQKFLLASYRGPELNRTAEAQIILASADATAQPAAPAVPKPRHRTARRSAPTAVAFAPDASDDGDLVPMQAVTSGYDANSRIVMAFQMASQAEY